MSIMWVVDTANRNMPNSGVVLKSETMRKSGRNATVETTSVAGLANKWFAWSTDGGGKGYTVGMSGTDLHYGEVQLEVIEYRWADASAVN